MIRLSGIRLTYTEEDKNYVHVEQKNVINVCDILQYSAYLALARCITLKGVLKFSVWLPTCSGIICFILFPRLDFLI